MHATLRARACTRAFCNRGVANGIRRYTRFVEIVVDAFAPQLMEVAAMQGEHVSQDDLLDFLGQVSSVDHFVHGLARVQQVPYYTRDDTACETGS